MHGYARDVDTWAEDASRSVNATILRRPADWNRYGRRAGILRNKAMIEEARRAEDVLILIFWDGLSLGTKDIIDRCFAAHIPHEILRHSSSLI